MFSHTFCRNHRPVLEFVFSRSVGLVRYYRGGYMVALLTIWSKSPAPLLWLYDNGKRREIGRAIRTK